MKKGKFVEQKKSWTEWTERESVFNKSQIMEKVTNTQKKLCWIKMVFAGGQKKWPDKFVFSLSRKSLIKTFDKALTIIPSYFVIAMGFEPSPFVFCFKKAGNLLEILTRNLLVLCSSNRVSLLCRKLLRDECVTALVVKQFEWQVFVFKL